MDHTDEYMDDVNGQKPICDLAQFLVENPSFILNVGDLVLYRWGDVQSWILRYRKSLRGKNKLFGEKLADLVQQVHDLSFTPPDGEDRKTYVNRIRGGILETLVGCFVQRRYNVYGNNCHVYVDGEPLSVPETEDPGKHPKTFDVAAVDSCLEPSIGELYECKVSGAKIDHYILSVVDEAARIFQERGLLNVFVGIVSFEGLASLSGKFKNLGFGDQKMVSIENLYRLKSYEDIKSVLG